MQGDEFKDDFCPNCGENVICLTCFGVVTARCKCGHVGRWCECKYPYTFCEADHVRAIRQMDPVQEA